MNLLSQLRDIHYPPAVSFWPLAIGWYFVMGLIIVAIASAAFFLINKWRKEYVKRLVLKRLLELESSQNLQKNIAEELSMLLKRAALAKYNRREVAGLHGEKWLSFLDKTAATEEFSLGPGRALLVSPYRAQSEKIPETLFQLIRDWVKKNL